MDEESLRIIRTLLTAFADFRQEAKEAEELPAVDLTEEIVEIDISNKADIRLNWKNRIVIRLGNESNLYKEINVLATSLALLQKSQGYGIAGPDRSPFLFRFGFGQQQAVLHAAGCVGQ